MDTTTNTAPAPYITIIDTLELADTTITTARVRFDALSVDSEIYTLVSTAAGEDTLIDPQGAHHPVSGCDAGRPGYAPARRVLDPENVALALMELLEDELLEGEL